MKPKAGKYMWLERDYADDEEGGEKKKGKGKAKGDVKEEDGEEDEQEEKKVVEVKAEPEVQVCHSFFLLLSFHPPTPSSMLDGLTKNPPLL